jgi:exosortase
MRRYRRQGRDRFAIFTMGWYASSIEQASNLMKSGPATSINALMDTPYSDSRDRLWCWSAGVPVAILAATFLFNVAPYWQVNPQYSFGWLVPVLCAFLFYRRWAARPAPAAASPAPARSLLALVALAFLPTWLVVQPNPDWRLATWALAVQFVATALLTLYFLGGSSWAKYFAFPVLFIFTAVPWPFNFEFPLVQGLMRAVAGVTVEILPWFHIAALQHGNLIEVRAGTLGVDEACSGIRSLQGTLMASLFLGEFYWLRPGKRVLLVLAGLVLAFVCNVGRAFLISMVAAQKGLEAISSWHDPAGYTILTLCLIGVSLIASLSGPSVPPTAPEGSRPRAHPLPRGLFAAVAVWLLFSMAATEAWYRMHEGGEKLRWSVRWPEARPSFTDLPISERTRDLLLYDEGRTASWQQPDGTFWSMFFFRWNSGSSRSRVVPRSHRPEICLPAGGYTLEEDYGTRIVRANGLEIPFHGYHFAKDGQHVRIFSCLWQDRPKAGLSAAPVREWNRLAGLAFVRRGERNLSQQVLEISMVGYDSQNAADAALEAELEQVIVP